MAFLEPLKMQALLKWQACIKAALKNVRKASRVALLLICRSNYLPLFPELPDSHLLLIGLTAIWQVHGKRYHSLVL